MILKNLKQGKETVFLATFVRIKADYKLQFAVTTSKKITLYNKNG